MDDEALSGARPRPDEPGDSGRSELDGGLAAEAESSAEREAAAEVAADASARPPADALIDDLREVRRAAAAAIGRETPPTPGAARGPSAAVLAATLFLIGSALLSISFLLTRGGLSIPIRTPEPSTVAAATGTPAAPAPTPAASVGASPTPALTPVPSVVATPPGPTVTPDPRLALLVPCPDKPDCYLYTVRQDDSLARISRRFAIPVNTILEHNPWIVDPNVIHRGDVLELPPPG